MIITRNLDLRTFFNWTWRYILLLLVFATAIAVLYQQKIIDIAIPWLPISVIGTAVAFYVGFKNNQAYDRMWEARKIWGGIINSSRAWGMQVDGFISNHFTDKKLSETELHGVKKQLIYRHIAWLYALRNQLLQPTPWEHISQGGKTARQAKYYQKRYGIGLVMDEVTDASLDKYLTEEEHDRLLNYKNTATQIINEQSRELKKLRESDLIEDFRHMEMTQILTEFYTLQGKCERIKKFPLPRQYASTSSIFVWIFVLMVPFSMMPELMKIGEMGIWLSIPITALVSWIYVMMEAVGDFSENPFQGMANDIPMLSLCRVIEIDLREMLGETDLPPAIEAKQGILM